MAESWQQLVASTELDAVCIGTWPYTHAEMTVAALEAGKHVLCEARMAMNAVEARKMLAAARAHPKLVAQIVPSPLTLKYDATIKKIVESGQLGTLVSIEVKGAGDAFVNHDAPMSWRQDRRLSGNNIMMMGIFYEALMRWVGGARTVMAMAKTVVPERSGEPVRIPDHIDILASMECGAQARMQFSSTTGLGGAMEFKLFGTEGTLHLDLKAQSLRVGTRGGQLAEVQISPEDAAGWRVEAEFVGAIRGEESVKLTDLATGVKYMAFTDAVHESLAAQRVATVDVTGDGAPANL